MIVTFAPAVQYGLIHALVIGAAEREGMFRPDHERRPFAARSGEGALQGMKLRAAHADVYRALSDREDVGTGVVQERLEPGAEIVVQDLSPIPPQLVLG
jgi:hypothetical protein